MPVTEPFHNEVAAVTDAAQGLGLAYGMGLTGRSPRIKECSCVPVKVANTRADLGESLVWDEHNLSLIHI